MVNPERTTEIPDKSEIIRGAVEHTITDDKLALVAAREMVVEDPTYALEAARVAHDLYPDDHEKRESFLRGTELRFLQQRQIRESSELDAIYTENTQSKLPKIRRRLGLRAIFSTFGLLTKSPRTNP